MMPNGRERILVAVLVTMAASNVVAQSEYPAPRFPDYLPANVTEQDLLDAARMMVERKSGGMLPGYRIEPGEAALIVVGSHYDERIAAAISTAVREAGATADVVVADVSDITGPLGDQAWGHLEDPIFHFMRVQGRNLNRMLSGGLLVEQTLKLLSLRNYDVVIAEYDGYTPRPELPSVRWEELFGGRRLPFSGSADEFLAANVPILPPPVRSAINEALWDQFRQARRVRVTDPEGTDVSWNVPAVIAEMPEDVAGSRALTRWVFHPTMCMPDYLQGKDLQSAETFRQVGFSGVIAGTANHVGVFPHIEVHVEDGHIERVEGGGKFGDTWRRVLAGYETEDWRPIQPGLGFGWIQECVPAGGSVTDVISFRPRDALRFPLGTLHEHYRAGVYHWGFGVQSLQVLSPESRAIMLERGIPDGHFDVHNYFPTMIVETATGAEIVMIDKGRVTALDDPQVRRIAAEYGDPDELLEYAWIPPVPGINVAGDYFEDYANDPPAWIAREYERFLSE